MSGGPSHEDDRQMSTTSDAVVYDPYEYEMHEDPYPTYERLREEAPLYRNEQMDFWALSRHADVLEGFRDFERFSNSHGVSLDPAASGPARTARCRSCVRECASPSAPDRGAPRSVAH